MKRGKKIMIWAIGLIGVAVAVNIVLFMFNASPFNLVDIEIRKSVPGANITKIDVLSTSGDVEIMPYEGTEIQAIMKGRSERKSVDDYNLHLKEEGNHLKIEATQIERTRFLSFSTGNYAITLQLPRKVYEQLHVKTKTANIQVNGIQTDAAVLEAVHGNISSLNLEGKVTGKTNVGDIDLNIQTITKDIEVASRMGNVTVALSEEPSALQTMVKTGLGEKTVILPNMKDGSIGSGGPLLAISSEVGNVALILKDK